MPKFSTMVFTFCRNKDKDETKLNVHFSLYLSHSHIQFERCILRATLYLILNQKSWPFDSLCVFLVGFVLTHIKQNTAVGRRRRWSWWSFMPVYYTRVSLHNNLQIDMRKKKNARKFVNLISSRHNCRALVVDRLNVHACLLVPWFDDNNDHKTLNT